MAPGVAERDARKRRRIHHLRSRFGIRCVVHRTHEIPADKAQRLAYQPERGDYETVPVYDRYALRAGQTIPGPAIVEERESTTVLHRGDRLAVDANGCLIIDVALPKLESLDSGVAHAH